jgi:exosome complex RNA-binding protein Rrp4
VLQTYGELPSGLLVRVSPAFARRLLQPDNVLLAALSK